MIKIKKLKNQNNFKNINSIVVKILYFILHDLRGTKCLSVLSKRTQSLYKFISLIIYKIKMKYFL